MALPEGMINGAFAETAVVRHSFLFGFFFLIFDLLIRSRRFRMIALFGESIASCTDITGRANAPP
jgi:hypothetical protein